MARHCTIKRLVSVCKILRRVEMHTTMLIPIPNEEAASNIMIAIAKAISINTSRQIVALARKQHWYHVSFEAALSE